MSKKKILIIKPIHEAGIELLKSNSNYDFEVVENDDPEFLKSKIKDIDGISIRTSKLTSDVIWGFFLSEISKVFKLSESIV